jgi:hypothetical protein
MALQGRDGETRVASGQIQRGRKRAMETRAAAIKAGQRRSQVGDGAGDGYGHVS